MESQRQDQRNVWIGRVEVQPFDDSELLAGVMGAFVNVLTWAVDADEFERKARELMDHLHLRVVDIDNVEPLAKRGPAQELDPEIARIAAHVRLNPDSIMYSTFHQWLGQIQ